MCFTCNSLIVKRPKYLLLCCCSPTTALANGVWCCMRWCIWSSHTAAEQMLSSSRLLQKTASTLLLQTAAMITRYHGPQAAWSDERRQLLKIKAPRERGGKGFHAPGSLLTLLLLQSPLLLLCVVTVLYRHPDQSYLLAKPLLVTVGSLIRPRFASSDVLWYCCMYRILSTAKCCSSLSQPQWGTQMVPVCCVLLALRSAHAQSALEHSRPSVTSSTREGRHV